MKSLGTRCALVFMIGLASPLAHAEDQIVRKPTAANRVVRVFDFEEQDLHGEPVPMHWVRAQDDPPIRSRPGFPEWNQAAFDLTVSRSGQASVKLPTQGGSTALQLVPGVLPVIPGGEYQVVAHLRTQGLQHARARLVAQFFDDSMQPIDASRRTTDFFGNANDWREISVQIPGEFPTATWLTIDLELLQRTELPLEFQGDAELELVNDAEDIGGAAWFDDLVVRIAPVLSLQTQRASCVLDASEPPIVTAIIDDVVGDPLTATLRLVDLDGRVVSEATFDHVRPGAPITWRPTPPVYGWWRVEFDVFADGAFLAQEHIELVWAPAPRHDLDRERLGVAIEMPGPDHRDVLLSLLRSLGIGAIEVPYWSQDSSVVSIQAATPMLTTLLERLLAEDFDVTFALESTPSDLARELRIGSNEVLRALGAGREAWSPWLDEALTRFGQRVSRWRIGTLEPRLLASPTATSQAFTSAVGPLADSVLNPLPLMPWPTEIALPDELNEHAVSLYWDHRAHAASIVDTAASLGEFRELTIAIQPLPRDGGSARALCADLAKRLVRAWQARPNRIVLEQPWTWREARDKSFLAEPQPEFLVLSRVGEHLRGREVVGELPIADGVTALVLDGEAGGAVIVWNDWAQPDQAVLRAYLGPSSIVAWDIFGNQFEAPLVDGAHHIPIPHSPLIIEGVDAELARFRAGFRVTPSTIESTAERHDLELVVENPWPIAVSGDLQIIGPETWSFAPQSLAFTIAAGEEQRFPIETSFGLAEEAGEHMIRARTRLIAAERYPPITVESPIDLRLTGVELIPSFQVRREAGGDTVIVTLLVINTGETPTTLMAFAQAPGEKRQQAPISDLPPRGAAARSFVFRHAREKLSNANVQVGVIESAGLGRLTRRIRIE